ncbi:uncharacterized protein LOC142977029 [Anticarsia gemmatalis]|uniref:uncharacterized protein LOC142977029 n=1 Tax=Anticarsia gemmatalis TaxID=129554 RepID=UPI003F7742A2
MGMIWRSAMPLLTTLAALVIIVHCVEEDLESEYRYDLRPRILDTGTPSHDQSWRAIEEEPAVQQPRHDHWDEHSPGDPPKRRRPGRKRKRRPQPPPDENQAPQERFAYPDESPRPYYEVEVENTRQTTEMSRRQRRPELRPIRWTDEVTANERPLRRKSGARRKRPSLNSWPEFSEFRDFPRMKYEEETISTEPPDTVHTDDQVNSPQEDILEQVLNSNQYMDHNQPEKHVDDNHKYGVAGDEGVVLTHINYDKSLSEFSPEMIGGPKEPEQPKQKSASVLIEYEKDQAHSSMDPLTLKDILKRSNGTSLSEILQQHNLSLTDLLNGKEHAVSIFKPQESLDTHNKNAAEVRNDLSEKEETKPAIKEDLEEKVLISSDTKYPVESATEVFTTTEVVQAEEVNTEFDDRPTTTPQPAEENVRKLSTRRRFPVGLRKKLRMRPMLNVTNTYKGQLSRDLIALNARKYSHSRRNNTKSKEWKDIIPSMRQIHLHNENNKTTVSETTTVTNIPEETAASIETDNSSNDTFVESRPQVDFVSKLDDINMDVTEAAAAVSIVEVSTEFPKNVTEKPMTVTVVTMARPTGISSGLRRQALNNRLKRKRLKQKNSTTEPPQDDLIKHLFGMGNLVSSSEFIARTQEPKTTIDEDTDPTTLEDFITTESTIKTERPTHVKTTTTKLTTPKTIIKTTTEETAKIEIEEIFNDTQTSAKLSRILKERNMTLSELVEHRERGSSHVHLADIFHNASREPNPPEPFLSKSLLEPISKETYPLRALLDANLHDANGKLTTIEPSYMNTANIPVVMDFRNNVNENAENMGIMSLFNNFTKSMAHTILPTAPKETDTTVSDITPTTKATKTNDTARESRILGEIEDDIVSWNEIFSLMGKPHNESEDLSANQPFKKIRLDEDADGDGLIVLEDLQHLKDFDSNIALGTNEKIDINPYDKQDSTHREPGILDKIPSQTKSVTVATASIAGLAMILFLLTYAAFKWKQQRSMIRKKRSFCDERIPTPVFENRKGHKNNSSSRSISPMLQTSNIYTLNTLDSQNGKESPDYMWDSLRKPFQ